MLKGLTIAWVRRVRQAWIVVLLGMLASSVVAVDYVRGHLGIQTDTADMISPLLDWRQRYIDFERQFPHFENDLAIVVEAQTVEQASQAAVSLSIALGEETEHFRRVDLPSDSDFFRRNALLFLDAQARADLIDELVNAQPLIGRLNRDPSLKTVAELFEDALRNPTRVEPATMQRFADELAQTIDATVADRLRAISWRKLLGGQQADTTRQIIRAEPVLDFRQLFPAESALQTVRRTAQDLQLTPAQGFRVRITGGLAMSDEELRTVSSGAERAAIFAFLGVFIVLFVGLGSIRMVLVTLVTLLVGLLWTAAFAAAAIGHLNMISVAFAVLYIGLGVDYAVHFALRYRELRSQGLDHARALDHTAGDVGVSIALCALTTGTGFFAFVPTSFAGVSELGLIAGVGMFISLLATLTLMPALMSALEMLPRATSIAWTSKGVAFGSTLDRVGLQRPRTVALLAALLAAVSVFISGAARFDENPLNLRDAHGEAVSTYRELVVADNNWSLDLLVQGLDSARAVSRDLQALELVADVVSVDSFVPRDQDQALLEIGDLAILLGPDLDGQTREQSAPASALAALSGLRMALSASTASEVGFEHLARSLEAFLKHLAQLDERARSDLLRRLQSAVVGTLGGELARMGDALDASRVSVATLPEDLLADWRAPDGRFRLRIDAAQDLNDPDALRAFVHDVLPVAPNAVGSPIVHLESAQVVVRAFLQAFILALACIAVILFFVLRRVRDVVIVLSPLLLGALVSVAVMVCLDSPFNFANVIALPVLLGAGVDSGIHMLSRARLIGGSETLASSSTARGVIVSALTTIVSFGNLAFSPHPGTASMGLLLTVGMVAILASTLLLLPAMVHLLDRPRLAESR